MKKATYTTLAVSNSDTMVYVPFNDYIEIYGTFAGDVAIHAHSIETPLASAYLSGRKIEVNTYGRS